MDFCSDYLESAGAILVNEKEMTKLKILEEMGYVISTEFEDSIAVKLKGHMSTEDGDHFFCIKEGDHGSK